MLSAKLARAAHADCKSVSPWPFCARAFSYLFVFFFLKHTFCEEKMVDAAACQVDGGNGL